MSQWLSPMFGGGLELVTDLGSIEALASRNQVVWDRVNTATFLTPDEKRAAIGYPPLGGMASQLAPAAPPKFKARRAVRPKGRDALSADEGDGGDTSGFDDLNTDTATDSGGGAAADNTSDFSAADAQVADAADNSTVIRGMVMDDSGRIVPADDNTSPLDTWGDLGTLQRHVYDHSDDFGATSPEDYANQASQFLQQAQQDNLPTLIDKDGNIHPYDADSNTFGAYNPDYTTRTFYKPNEGADYFTQKTQDVEGRGGNLINGEDIPPPMSKIFSSPPSDLIDESIAPDILFPE